MKKFLLSIICVLFYSNILKSQADTSAYLTLADSLPTFLYGDYQFSRFIQMNLIYPPEARKKEIQGFVYVSFVVDTIGNVSNSKILKDIGGGCGNEALKAIQLSSGIWKSGIDKGKKVKVLLNLPVKFTCTNCSNKGTYIPNTDPNYFANYFYDRANEELNANRFLTSILYFTKSLSYKPNFKDAISKRGYAKFKNQDKKGACADWLSAQKLGDKGVDEFINLNCK
jgi:TonB family protein